MERAWADLYTHISQRFKAPFQSFRVLSRATYVVHFLWLSSAQCPASLQPLPAAFFHSYSSGTSCPPIVARQQTEWLGMSVVNGDGNCDRSWKRAKTEGRRGAPLPFIPHLGSHLWRSTSVKVRAHLIVRNVGGQVRESESRVCNTEKGISQLMLDVPF